MDYTYGQSNQYLPPPEMFAPSSQPHTGPPQTSQPRPFIYNLPIKPDCVGMVIGAKGRTIQKIQRDTGAFASLRQPEPANNRPLPYIFLRGNPMSVIRAAIKITEIVTEAAHRNQGSDSKPPHSQHGVSAPINMSEFIPSNNA